MTQPAKVSFPGVYCSWFDPAKTYVIIGGLGGLGLELSVWMVRRGARKLVLVSSFSIVYLTEHLPQLTIGMYWMRVPRYPTFPDSRNGVKTGYQTKKVAYLKRLGSEVEVAPLNVNTVEKVRNLVTLASKLGPIGGFFNMGLVLDEGPFLELTVQSCLNTAEVKVTTTMLLDQVSREKPLRSTLDHFVVFSSVVAYHGHVGQSSYAFANSVAEQLCEKRKADGLPGLAIQWGAVADVGHVGNMGNHVVICGKYPQRLQSVISVFDYSLGHRNSAVVASYVQADRSASLSGDEESVADQIARAVAKIIGLKDVTAVDGDKEFVELGMDSLMSIEVKQLLERELNLVLSSKDIHLLSFNSLKNLVES
ncbi:fatty acid synthase [Plakobranchus ocellatus]|uniref:Fatty acid synthase n=1 Tax=Plakobranchus ocellatus TaxID=259542 RepID=A0AAV4AE39_9GAST|nr:fatty acid synthase [Plakobranchus ocellatus]